MTDSQDDRELGVTMSATTRLIAGAIVLAAITGFAGQAAMAQTQQQLDWCSGKNAATADQQIGGCTALIQTGKFTGKTLALIFSNRGAAYKTKGQYDRAIQDYDQAIKLNPNYARAFSNRSLAKEKKDDKAGADADMAAAKRIDPNIAP